MLGAKTSAALCFGTCDCRSAGVALLLPCSLAAHFVAHAPDDLRHHRLLVTAGCHLLLLHPLPTGRVVERFHKAGQQLVQRAVVQQQPQNGVASALLQLLQDLPGTGDPQRMQSTATLALVQYIPIASANTRLFRTLHPTIAPMQSSVHSSGEGTVTKASLRASCALDWTSLPPS